jgi:hypothetical protein
MMKRFAIYIKLLLLLCTAQMSFAQDEFAEPFFTKKNVFTGGTFNGSFGNGITSFGISPYFGYSINKYVDVAASVNLNFSFARNFFASGDRLNQSQIGPGAFVRLFPADFLFVQGQYEFNMLRNRYIPLGATGSAIQQYNFDAHSFLVGPGISNGKDFPNQKSYYYFSILWDIAKSANSPYVDNLGRSRPVIRAGYHIALFQKSK